MATVYKTAVFKLHNPSKHRKAMLIDCMQRAEHAYWKVLNKIKPEVDAMKDMDRKERRQALFALKKKIDSYLVPLPLAQSAQRGVQEDTYMQAFSYLELLVGGQEAGWPDRKDRNADYFNQGLERLVNYESENKAVQEVIMATNPTLEGDGTALFISNMLEGLPVKITRLARGIAAGSVLEFSNREVLADAMKGRQPF